MQRVDKQPIDVWGARFRHDLRQPLTAAALLLEEVADTPSLERVTTARIRETQRQVRWALELLQSQDSDEPGVDLLDLGALIARVVEPKASWAQVSLVCQQRCFVAVQSIDLMRAARNLIDNAVHASTCVDGPHLVEVSVRRRRSLAVLAVDDSGPGFGLVPARHGLGLSSVRDFARRSGGSLAIGTSRWGGASVSLSLPAVAHTLAG